MPSKSPDPLESELRALLEILSILEQRGEHQKAHPTLLHGIKRAMTELQDALNRKP